MIKNLTSCFLVISGCLIAGGPAPVIAQSGDQLTLERIYKENDFIMKGFGPVRWLKDGSGYTSLEPSTLYKGAKDIIQYIPGTGERRVLVGATQLIPGGQAGPLDISDYTWSADGKKLLIFTNTARVWRYHTRGDYWVVDLESGGIVQLGAFAEPSTLMFAKFSPDGTRVGYVVDHDIYVENLETSVVTRITHDGSDRIINGTFDWVYEEEFDCRDGFRWSPDGEQIAYWQSDTKGTGTFYLINNIDSIYSQPIPLPYPKAGTANSAVRIGVAPAGGEKPGGLTSQGIRETTTWSGWSLSRSQKR